MSFGGLILTNSGRNELIQAEMGGTFNITHVVLGDGSYNGSYTAINSLVNKVMEIPITRISRSEDEIQIECDFNSLDVPRAFYLREIGIMANGVLCYYDNSRGDTEYIDPESDVIVKQKRMRFILMISSDINVNVTIGSSLYALAVDLEGVIHPVYEEAVVLEEPAPGDSIFRILGKMKKAAKELISHLGNKSNPHEVSKKQVGLGNVPNVATNDQTPTYTPAASLTDLISGEKLKDAMGKLSTAVTQLISHLGNKSNPHGVTKAQVGLGNVPNVTTNDQTPAFTQAATRDNIASNEKLSVIFGKLMKWYADLKAVAFSGSYNDLTNKPASLPADGGTAETISSVLPVSKGGTGKATAGDAANMFLNSLDTGASTPKDEDYYISQYAGGGTTTTTYHRRPMSALWNYIKGKLSAVATSGSYNDLTNKPAIPAAVAVKGNAESNYRTGNVNLTPANIGAAPASHASKTTTYGASSAADYGHAMASSTTPKAAGTAAVGSETDKFARGDHVHPLQTSVSGSSGSCNGNSATATKLATARNINGMSVDGSADRVNYGTCSTAAATVAKVVDCTGFSLVTGAEITVKFTVTNTASSPTLNVNGTGAKSVYYRGAAIIAGYLAANRTYTFRYNGTQWDLVGDINTDTNTTYSNMTAATADVAGKAGLVPAPSAGAQNKVLKGNATWDLIENMTTAFTQASTRANLVSGETIKTSLGKIMKWFSDLSGGAASTLLGSNLTANRALITNSSGKVAVSAVTSTELGYLDGVTSNVQDQIDELNMDLDTALKVITVKSVSTSVPVKEFSISIPVEVPDGYTILGVAGWGTGQRTSTITISSVAAGGTNNIWIQGYNSGSIITFNLEIKVLLCKSVLL